MNSGRASTNSGNRTLTNAKPAKFHCQLVGHGNEFLIIGSRRAITYSTPQETLLEGGFCFSLDNGNGVRRLAIRGRDGGGSDTPCVPASE